MMIVLPVVLLVVFGYAANFEVHDIPTVVVGPGARQAAASAAAADLPRHRGRSRRGRGHRPVQAAGRPGGRRGGHRRHRLHVLMDGTQLFSVETAEGALAKLSASTRAAGLPHRRSGSRSSTTRS